MKHAKEVELAERGLGRWTVRSEKGKGKQKKKVCEGASTHARPKWITEVLLGRKREVISEVLRTIEKENDQLHSFGIGYEIRK